MCRWQLPWLYKYFADKQQQLMPSKLPEGLSASSNHPNPLCSLPLKITYLLITLWVVFQTYHFGRYLHISSQIKAGEQQFTDELIDSLEWLTHPSLPVLRQYFFEQLIYEQAHRKNWGQVIDISTEALGYEGNAGRFSIYYHLSMAHCMQSQFEECRTALDKAYVLAGRANFQYLADLYDILVSNGVIQRSEVPSNQVHGSGRTGRVRKNGGEGAERGENLQQVQSFEEPSTDYQTL